MAAKDFGNGRMRLQCDFCRRARTLKITLAEAREDRWQITNDLSQALCPECTSDDWSDERGELRWQEEGA